MKPKIQVEMPEKGPLKWAPDYAAEEKSFCSVGEAAIAVFGGFGALSPDLYAHGVDYAAEMCGRVADQKFKRELAECLRSLPCSLD
jgi:hypothetical protein